MVLITLGKIVCLGLDKEKPSVLKDGFFGVLIGVILKIISENCKTQGIIS
jgi:hypothetical protein